MLLRQKSYDREVRIPTVVRVLVRRKLDNNGQRLNSDRLMDSMQLVSQNDCFSQKRK